MRKILGITLGGLQKKTITLVLIMLLIMLAAFAGVSTYQNKMLVNVVGATRADQQEAISQVSEETMQEMLEGALVSSTTLRADLADSEFSEIVNNVYMLQTMAQGLLESRHSFDPLQPSLPDPALNGTPSAMVLCEEGVDYTQSEYLGIIAHMSSAMIAMHYNSDKIDGCYIGLADGTDLCIDEKAANKLDENGDPIPFPVRERPWYRGAIEADGLYFTGVEHDAFSNRLLVTCSVPIKLDGEVVGVAGIDIVLETMADFTSADTARGTYAYVVNDRGQVILGPEGRGVFELSDRTVDLHRMGNNKLSQFVDKALRQTTGLQAIDIQGNLYYMVGSPMPTVGWAVISVVDKVVTEQPKNLMLSEYNRINEEASDKFSDGTARTKWTTAFILLGVFLIGLGAALFAARRIVKPIEQMTKSIVRSSQTGELFQMEDSYRTDDEIELLAEAFDDLSKKTKRYIGQITEITAEKERINTELSLATKIQTAMMPHIFPAFPGRPEFEIYASMNPAKEVGGDFYDFFLVDDDHLCMVMADVSGKGIPAALFMMASKIILQSCAMLGQSPAEILTKTNEAICSNNQEEMFVTVWLGILEISTGKLTAANAGHEYPVLKKAGGGFELLRDKHGLVIGAMDGVRYKEYELQLEPGAKLFVYTDGVPEATNGDKEMFGLDRMLTALNEIPDAEPKDVLEHVRTAVDIFVRDAEQFDDITMLCMEYYGKDLHSHDSESKG